MNKENIIKAYCWFKSCGTFRHQKKLLNKPNVDFLPLLILFVLRCCKTDAFLRSIRNDWDPPLKFKFVFFFLFLSILRQKWNNIPHLFSHFIKEILLFYHSSYLDIYDKKDTKRLPLSQFTFEKIKNERVEKSNYDISSVYSHNNHFLTSFLKSFFHNHADQNVSRVFSSLYNNIKPSNFALFDFICYKHYYLPGWMILFFPSKIWNISFPGTPCFV